MSKKIFINKLNDKLSKEFPEIQLKITKILKTYIIFEIFYNTTKSDSETNKFNIIDGGRKNRIIRKLKSLLNLINIQFHNIHNIFII